MTGASPSIALGAVARCRVDLSKENQEPKCCRYLLEGEIENNHTRTRKKAPRIALECLSYLATNFPRKADYFFDLACDNALPAALFDAAEVRPSRKTLDA